MTEAMKTAPQGGILWRGISCYAAPAFILLAMVVTFLRFHEYSLLLPESLVLMGAAIAAGIVLGAIGRLRPETLGPAFVALPLAAYAFYRPEVTDSLLLLVRRFADTKDVAGVGLVVIGVGLFLAIFVICILMRRNLSPIVSAVFGTIALTTLILPVSVGGEAELAGAIPENRADLPPVIHIVLDEHTGLDGVPSGFAQSAEARRAIEATFEDFQLHSRAYSRFAETVLSLASLLNGNLGEDVSEIVDNGVFVFTPQRNDWFDILKRRGYAISVYQSAWLDFCGGPVPADACYTYPLFSPNAVQRMPLSVGERLGVLAKKLVFGVRTLQTSPLAANEALDRFSSDVARAPRGVAYVLHLLMPHHDYFYSSDCSLADPSAWEREEYGDDGVFSDAERDRLYDRYLGQMICTDRRIETVLARLKEIGVYEEATIIVHGDHGSRNGRSPYMGGIDRYSEAEMIDNFATLFAVKAPGIAPGIRREPAPIQELFAELFLEGEAVQAGDDVLVRTRDDGIFGSRQFVWGSAVAEAPAEQAAVAASGAVEELRR